MAKKFNVSAACLPERDYMVDLSGRLAEIKQMVDAGQYFTMNRARRYGKTTTLKALAAFLNDEYIVISLDFQMFSYIDFESETRFVEAFAREVLDAVAGHGVIPCELRTRLSGFAEGTIESNTLSHLFRTLTEWCRLSEKITSTALL